MKARRYVIVGVGLLLVVGGLAAIKFLQISKVISWGKEMQAAGPPPEAVGTAVAQAQVWERTLRAPGTVASIESIEIRNEVAGVAQRVNFSSGGTVKAGALLVELEAATERSQLAASRARRDLAEKTLRRAQQLVREGAMSQAEQDDARSAFDVADREVAEVESRLAKKLIRAPFAGRLGIREVSAGQFLEVGTKITVLDAVGEVFVDFSVPQEQVAEISPGAPVRVSFDGAPRAGITANVIAMQPTVDAATRHLGLRARVVDPKDRLRPGMFVNLEVSTPERLDVVVVPATAIVHASYGDSVFVVEDKDPNTPGMKQTPDGKQVRIARQQFVRVGMTRGDFVQVLEGLPSGAEVVTAGAFKLRNESPVVVDNSTAPKATLDPKPENR